MQDLGLLQGHEVVFEPKDHQYYVDGNKVYSVTQILGWKFKNDYKDVDKEVLRKAADLGTAMHEAIEDLERYGIHVNDMVEVDNWLVIKRMFGIEVVECELPVLISFIRSNGEERFIVGRLDQVVRVGYFDNVLAINDLKRNTEIHEQKVAYQDNLYRLGLKQTYGMEAIELLCTNLRKDVRKLHRFKVNEDATYKLLEEFFNEIDMEEITNE